MRQYHVFNLELNLFPYLQIIITRSPNRNCNLSYADEGLHFFFPDMKYLRNFQDAMSCADDLFKFLCKWVFDNCSDDMKFVSKRIDKNCIDRLQSMISSTVEQVSYNDAVDLLKKVYHAISFSTYHSDNDFHLEQFFPFKYFWAFLFQVTGKTFETKLEWGAALTAEHLRYANFWIIGYENVWKVGNETSTCSECLPPFCALTVIWWTISTRSL